MFSSNKKIERGEQNEIYNDTIISLHCRLLIKYVHNISNQWLKYQTHIKGVSEKLQAFGYSHVAAGSTFAATDV